MRPLIASFLAIMLCVVARAEPITLTNKQADELLSALSHLRPGLTALNTTRAARNINALTPVVKAWTDGVQAAQKKYHIVSGMKTDDPAYLGFLAEVEASAKEVITVELQRFSISDDEAPALPAPADFAVILRHLEPPPSKPSKK